MTEPRVVAMMLTADRQAYTERAIKCFFDQTYQNKQLFVLDNGQTPFCLRDLPPHGLTLWRNVHYVHIRRNPADTIGMLRNLACELIGDSADMIAHWDSDDWSHPLRLEESVEHLSQSGAEVFGYHEMYFYRKSDRSAWIYKNDDPRHYIIGTSMLYWRSSWLRSRFPPMNNGEDTAWQKNLVRHSASSLPGAHMDTAPRMIAEIHGGNTTSAGDLDELVKTSDQYRRVHSVEGLEVIERYLGYR